MLEWPQSNESIVGPERFVRMNHEYPAHGPWRFTLHRLVAGRQEVVTDVSVSDGVQHARAVSFFTVRADRITKLVEFWPEPYAAAASRAHLVEPIAAASMRSDILAPARPEQGAEALRVGDVPF